MPKKPPELPEERPVASDCYPSAPLDPAARRDFMRRRNARIAQVDEDDYMAMMTEQDKRVRRHGDELKRT